MSNKSERRASDSETTGIDSEWNPTVGSLIPRNQTLVRVSPNDKLMKATTLMMTHDYSQLPVVQGRNKVDGVISWKSIGASRITRLEGDEVRHYIGTIQIAKDTDSLFEVTPIIAEHDYILVCNQQQDIIGIVTASDLSIKFRDLYEPLYLCGSVELNLRQIIQSTNYDDCDFEKAKVDSNAIEELTLGEYYRLIGPEQNWRKLNLQKVDRGEFRKALCKTKDIRNSVVHFRVSKLGDEKMAFLRSFSEFVRKLAITRSK